jgi:CheY-like chemotaxis protein
VAVPNLAAGGPARRLSTALPMQDGLLAGSRQFNDMVMGVRLLMSRGFPDAIGEVIVAQAIQRPLIVLIEDDNRLAPALAMLIEDWGYECIAVRSPAAAAEQLGRRVADVKAVVADFSRDDAYTGRRSAAAIEAALGAKVPVIVATNEPALARSHGFVDVLDKPSDPEVLQQWLGQHVRLAPPGRMAC